MTDIVIIQSLKELPDKWVYVVFGGATSDEAIAGFKKKFGYEPTIAYVFIPVPGKHNLAPLVTAYCAYGVPEKVYDRPINPDVIIREQE